MKVRDKELRVLVDVAEKACPTYQCYWPRPDPGIFTPGQGYRQRSIGNRGWLCGRREIHGCPLVPKMSLIKALTVAVLFCALASPSHAAQVCTDAGEFQRFALSHQSKSAEIDNLTKQIGLYLKNVGNLKEQNGLLKREVALLQEAVGEQKKLNASCELLIDEHKKVLADALAALDEATKESLVEKGIYIGTGFALGVAARGAWVKWVR